LSGRKTTIGFRMMENHEGAARVQKFHGSSLPVPATRFGMLGCVAKRLIRQRRINMENTNQKESLEAI